MKNLIATAGTTLAIFLFAVCLSTHAEVHLPAIFSDGMVMQQQTHANLWGTATPNKKVTVRTSWDGKLYAVNKVHGNYPFPLPKQADLIQLLLMMELRKF